MSVEPMEILAELEQTHEEMKTAGKARFCPTRRRSVSCSRLAPSPLPDILVFQQLLKNRDDPPKSTRNQCGTPMTEYTMNTGSGSSSGYTPVRTGRSSAFGALPQIPLSAKKSRSKGKGKSWFHPKTWMRKKRPVMNVNMTPVRV